tara:strand:+ start:11509 stop:12459 length:951 start_codon:yes stop_codon:yes gene_type:complete
MIKAITGKDYTFEWNAPAPLNGLPSITFKASSTVTSNMTHSRNDINVTGIANDRRTLTINNSSSLESDQVKAFLKTDGDSFYPVKINRIVGTSAVLSDPLPREIDLSSNAIIEFAMYYYTASSLDVTSISGTYEYEVSYVSDLGQNTQNKIEKGVIKVTPRPFNTGLSHDILVDQFSNLSDLIPRRQADFNPQISSSLNELSLMLRDRLSNKSVTEDEIFNTSSFELSHAYLAASKIYEMNLQLDISEYYYNKAIENLELALRTVDLDLDGDGIIDDGELNIEVSGGKSSDLRASWKSYIKSDYDKSFTPKRGMRH